MPSPVFLWGRAYGGAEPLPYAPMMGFRRAACPHTAAKGGQGRSPLRKYWNACVGRGRTPPLRRSYKRCGTERYPSPFRQGKGQFSDGAMGRVVRLYGWIWGRCNRADVGSELSAASGG